MEERVFQLKKQVLLAVRAKRWGKKEEVEGCRGSMTGQGKQVDKEAKPQGSIFFLGLLIQIASKRPQAFVWHVAERMQIPAR